MKERIGKIMDMRGMNSTQFASATGIKTATLSHIFSGRTFPSTEVVSKILERFPDVSPDWLLFGKGEMLRSGTPPASENRLGLVFDHQASDGETVNSQSDVSKKSDNKEIIYVEKPAKTIEKLMIFYSDNSFETFVKE
ncbi:MAG: helix-turn-helix domain-containing protein [Tannerella sp.]|jgi:transcriptional regulator with XRE-family HTH domain|nr:helix-turn-helix domain-containing protein [Tannerella sp.]